MIENNNSELDKSFTSTITNVENLEKNNEKDDNNKQKNVIGVLGLIEKTKFLTQFTAATLTGVGNENRNFEPLPFVDYSLFDETKSDNSVYLKGLPINVNVRGKRRNRRHIFCHYNYLINLSHGNYSWSVIRDYSSIKDLHRTLCKMVEIDIGKECSKITKDQIKEDWPLFPCENDFNINESNITERCKNIQDYLQRLLTYPPFRDHKETLNFLAVSVLTFKKGIRPSLMEGFIHKHTYDNFYTGHLRSFKQFLNANLKILNYKRWFVLKDTYIAYIKKEKENKLGFVILFDVSSTCKKKIKPGAYHALVVKNQQKTLILKCKNSQQQREWYAKINNVIYQTAKCFTDINLLSNGSYAPIRENQLCKWYLNACLYMQHVMNGLNNAREEIYIADWWLCPELYLRRPTDDLQYRLDKILHKKANEGVKVYILLFKPIDALLDLKTERTRNILTQYGNNSNIKVIRHPKFFSRNTILWSHHEKFVIIDQSVAFLGGIDLCYGRWDDDSYRLTDLGKVKNITDINENSFRRVENDDDNQENSTNIDLIDDPLKLMILKNGAEMTSDTNKFHQLEDPEKQMITFKRMISNTCSSEESNYYEYAEESKKQLIKRKINKIKQNVRFRRNSTESYESLLSNINEEMERKEDENLDKDLIDKNLGQYYFIGKDYSNIYKEDFKELEKFSTDQFDRTKTPRMPWRDQAMVIVGDSARDLARHFILRWNYCKYQMDAYKDAYPYLLPKSYQSKSDYENHLTWLNEKLSNCNVQMLRSLDSWSGGLAQTECSILKAYCKLIDQAEHYIYIENQFFVTTTNSKYDLIVQNEIGAVLANRIKRAYDEKKKFRVYVILPLLPGFDNINNILSVQYFNLRAIKFGDYSIYKELTKYGIKDPSEFITFHGMRKWDVLMGNLVQEIIYIHSKSMIVDDKYVLCGSANINDRSMLGKRDSEVASLIEDNELIDSKLNGQLVKVGKYAFSLRKKIFKIHLGIYFDNPNNIDVSDCVCDEFYFSFKQISTNNANIYDKCFKCIPSNNIKTLKDLYYYANKSSLSKTDPKKAKEMLDKNLMGLLVDFPIEFLSGEKNFYPSILTKQGLAPYELWT